ncbi:MAG: VWA domain-containing protein [Rhodocyclaceae bacterium]|nr:VWA domain-containing protein [Rhodocyclaceae bacterium]
MEEWIGALWDRWIRQVAAREYPHAAAELRDLEKSLGVFFRAMGGEGGLRIAAAAERRHGARRRWRDRLAGVGERVALATLDAETLCLPPRLAVLPETSLNRDLYFWLAALAAAAGPVGLHAAVNEDLWLRHNQAATSSALARFPGLESRYRRLVEAHLAERMPPAKLPADEAAQERAIRQALREPGSVRHWPRVGRRAKPVQPVLLWLHPTPPRSRSARTPTEATAEESTATEVESEQRRYHAERQEAPKEEAPMVLVFRAESLLSWAEYLRLNRALDGDENPDAGRVAQDLEKLTLAETNVRAASKVRFDLDLPAASEDDLPLGEGVLLPEWDWRRAKMLPDYCCVQTYVARAAVPQELAPRLQRPARKLKNRFAALMPVRRWLKAQPEGREIDLDAYVRIAADRRAGWHFSGVGAYLDQRPVERDLACLVLADLSLSTDAHANDEQKVIDVIRDSLMLFGEALSATGDRFAFYGFSSLKRHLVRFHEIKRFEAAFDATTRGRIAALKPGYYTRMGAAVRRAVQILAAQPHQRRLLILLTDGKPHDLDHYEGRYGIEDSRKALMEAREAGVRPFCITIDRTGARYLPHLFGPAGYTVVQRPEKLPERLAMMYAQLTGNL